jgi:redox-sensitive bicupin YhaK (pirin superfamily)
VERVTVAPHGLEGEGFPVKRAFAGVPLALLDPFVHMDEMGAVDYGPGEPKGTPWHPHRGFETVTYMLEGQFVHQDSTGGGGRLGAGDTQWMTAGAGILHIETPPEELVIAGGLFHGFQLWVNLPAAAKWSPPRYQDIGRQRVAIATNRHRDATFRVIAGSLGPVQGPGVTYTPINLVHVTLMPDASARMEWPATFNLLIYVMEGRALIGERRVPVSAGQLAVTGAGAQVVLFHGGGAPTEVLLLGGQPIREPVVHYGPFVMNTRAEIEQALEDYRAGRMGQVPVATLPHEPLGSA